MTHVGINNLLHDRNESPIDILFQNIGAIIEMCQFYVIYSISVSGLIYTNSVKF